MPPQSTVSESDGAAWRSDNLSPRATPHHVSLCASVHRPEIVATKATVIDTIDLSDELPSEPPDVVMTASDKALAAPSEALC